MKKTVVILSIILVVLLLLTGMLEYNARYIKGASAPETQPPTETSPPQTQPVEETAPPTEPTEPPTTEPEPTEPPPTEPPFEPMFTEDSDPQNWNVECQIIVGDEKVDSYTREEPIFFEKEDYFSLPGIATFRGDNHHTGATYGTAQISDESITELWRMNVGFLETADWIGCGWTGQPLVAQWDAETRAIMNLYDSKKEKEDLVEAVYAKMDGYVHFIDMEDGSYTRDPLYVGMVFKGSGALDPRGYPILYLGSGMNSGGKQSRIFAISLIDGSVLYEMSGSHALAPRFWYGFDGAPLVDAQTDTLIWGGENGLLYTIKLNTQYDKAAGTLTMEPDAPVMASITHNYYRNGRYAGYEASVTAADHYLYVADNSGMLSCLDVNTMELMWSQDIMDDVNASPLFEWGEDGRGYVYVSPSMDYIRGKLPVNKIDAQTGEIIWTQEFECKHDSDVPGGTLASPLLGKAGTNLEDIIIFSIGRSPNIWSGQVIAFHKETGEILWQYQTRNYMWSSPVALYTEDGQGYIFQADASGNCYLMDGLTGEVVDEVSLGRTVESSPVVFGDRVLLGTRTSIHLFKIS